MIIFFKSITDSLIAIQAERKFSTADISKLIWLLGDATPLDEQNVKGVFLGPRATMITPWSTNAVEITRNMGIEGITRMERFTPHISGTQYDFLLFQQYDGLGQDIFDINIEPAPVLYIDDIAAYNKKEGLALSDEEVAYLDTVAEKIGRKLTDSEVFGFSQVNSEHCRHKIFNGTFVIDGEEMPETLFQLIKKTSQVHPNNIVSAYKDNVAFLNGPKSVQFAPQHPDVPSSYRRTPFDAVLSLKAETHNFPTTVEPFNGAATGSGGEIRDRMAGGIGSIPQAGTAVYMTPYARLSANRPWEQSITPRPWLYQTPIDILIKASNGASDFGNKFGQPLIAGSLLTFEHTEAGHTMGYDKVIMLAGGIGYAKKEQALKNTPQKGDVIIVMGGDNYRIGMGGAAVSSADTGAFDTTITLNAVQRANPEMQKRVANAIRALVEHTANPIVSIHDHGAGGHLNCLSELVEETGGKIYIDALPIGDETLSAKEIIGNESQERMGLILKPEDVPLLRKIAERERAPMYEVGVVTGDFRFSFESRKTGEKPIDLALSDMFGSSPKTIMQDETLIATYAPITYDIDRLETYIKQVLKLEAVACKDWLTNKVDRCVGGKVAVQQCVGQLQLPLNNCGVMALDFEEKDGIATSIGHAPIGGLIDSAAGARLAVTEALTNLVWAPLSDGLEGVSLSANWMWPCRNAGEDARLYEAVRAVSEFCIELGINVPTGKDSLSMAQKYEDKTVLAPGTVIISAIGSCKDYTKVVEPVFIPGKGKILYVDCSLDDLHLGGSSFAQSMNKIGENTPDVKSAAHLKKVFDAIQKAISFDMIAAGHDIAAGGMITTLLELCFANKGVGAIVDITAFGADAVKVLLSEKPGLLLQASDERLEAHLKATGVDYKVLGAVTSDERLRLETGIDSIDLDINEYRDIWYETSYLFDKKQTANNLATARYKNYKNQPLTYSFPDTFTGKKPAKNAEKRPIAAIIREKGSNSEREMANALYQAGFEVRDVHMTDLISGREDLSDVRFLGAVGGFSNSDVLGSAKGWAGAFRYNEKAQKALQDFFNRPDTLSVGICNGCQLFLELDLINPNHERLAKMTYNDSHKHESAFTSVRIGENNSVMMHSLAGCTLGVWISHGEGKFSMPMSEDAYNIVAKYSYDVYPANPNGSDYNTAMLVSDDGRHLVTMPHIERSLYPWNWAYYPLNRQEDEVSPWMEAFRNAYEWIATKTHV